MTDKIKVAIAAGVILLTVSAVSQIDWVAQVKNKNSIDVRSFGAKCNGTFDDSTAFNSAIASLTNGGIVDIPQTSTCIAGAYIGVNNPNITIRGNRGSVIKAKDNARLANGIIVGFSGSTGLTFQNFTLDGNRDNAGTVPGGSYGLYIAASNTTVDRVEVKNCANIGIWVGDGSGGPSYPVFTHNNIHDNGGLVGGVTVLSDGVGIYGTAIGAVIDGNIFKNNHSKVVPTHDSTGFVIEMQGGTVVNNYFEDNFNVSGGQFAVSSNGTCSGHGGVAISGNTIVQTTTFGADNTGGIELCSRDNTVTGNTVYNQAGYGIASEIGSGNNNISGNTVISSRTNAVGFQLIASGGVSPDHVSVFGNRFQCAFWGIGLDSLATYISVIGNDVRGSGTALVAAGLSNLYIANNPGYNPVGYAAITVTASPMTYTAGFSPETIYITSGTVSSVNFPTTGITACAASPCSVQLDPNVPVQIVYSVAPTIGKQIH